MDHIAPNYRVIFFQLDKEKAIERLLGRMYDPQTGETFPSGTSRNPKTGAELIVRKDDNEASIKNRIDAFYSHTLPVVEQLKEEGKVIEVNADQAPEVVYTELTQKL